MTDPVDLHELQLVELAIALGRTTGGCCEWQDRAVRRIRAQPPLRGFTPEGIKQLLCEFVARQQGAVEQVVENRDEYRDRRFYYKVVVPIPEFVRGLFIELVLIDDDPEYPVVSIVNAHEQGR